MCWATGGESSDALGSVSFLMRALAHCCVALGLVMSQWRAQAYLTERQCVVECQHLPSRLRNRYLAVFEVSHCLWQLAVMQRSHEGARAFFRHTNVDDAIFRVSGYHRDTFMEAWRFAIRAEESARCSKFCRWLGVCEGCLWTHGKF